MTREEILKAALANANGQNPVELAKQMQEFLDGEPKPQPKIGGSELTIASLGEAQMIFHAPKHDTEKSKRKSPTYPKVRPPNHCKPWTDEELLKAADLVKDARTRRDLENIARQLGRTSKGFVECLYKGLVPIDPATLHKSAFPHWDKVPGPKASK